MSTAVIVIALAVVVIGIPAWMCRYEAPPPLKVSVAVRYLLQCLALFLLGLLALRDPLLTKWALWAIIGAALCSGMLALVVVDALRPI